VSPAEELAALTDLGTVLRAAAAGAFPQSDGGWERAGLWLRGVEAVVALTGHAYLAVGQDLGVVELDALGVDGYGGAHHPRVAERIRGSGWADTLDVLLVRPAGLPAPSGDTPDLVAREDLASHPRVALARHVRSGVRVLGMPSRRARSLVTLATGLGGLPEIGLEAEGTQSGAQLLAAALCWAERGLGGTDPLIAAVPPGNARSLRLFLGEGFVPVGSVQLFRPERHPWVIDGRPGG
jgi:hypothetical protein